MRRKVLWIAFVLVALIAIVAALRPTPERRFAELVADLRARGEPVTLAELEPPMPPDADNGVADLRAANAWYEANDPESLWPITTGEPWSRELPDGWIETTTPEQHLELQKFLGFLAPYFEHLDRAADKSEIAWPLGPRDSVETVAGVIESVPAVQAATRFLDVRAEFGATPDERLRAIRVRLAIGTRLRARALIEYMVANSIHRAGCLSLRTALTRGRIDPVAARAQFDDLLAREWGAGHARMLRSERAWWCEEYPYWLDGSAAELHGVVFTSPWERFRRSMNELFGGGWRKVEPESPFETIEAVRGLDRFLDPALDREAAWRESESPAARRTSMTRIYSLAGKWLTQADALARLSRLSLAAYEHRGLHGAWPSTPEDLAPLFPGGVPLDPWSGAPFVFEPDGDTLVLRAQPWDGLVEPSEEVEKEELDHVWRLSPR